MVNALLVVTDYSQRFSSEIYTFFKELGLSFQQFIPCVEPAPRVSSETAPFSVSPEAYGAFLKAIFDLWMADFKEDCPTTSVRFFDALFQVYIDRPPSDCTLRDTCGIYLVVEHNGDLFPCDFYVYADQKLGNVLDDDLEAVFNSPQMDAFSQAKCNLPEACVTCRWLAICNGGCPKDRPRSPGQYGPN